MLTEQMLYTAITTPFLKDNTIDNITLIKHIQFLLDNTFDLACGHWPAPPGNSLTYSERPTFELNASIIAINSKNVNQIFPIVEKEEYVEILLGHELFTKVREIPNSIIFELKTRRYTDYGGDGLHTNNIETIKEELTKANIPYE